MNLQTTVEIFAGGPGSGCRGPNCGRPRGTNDPEFLEAVKNTEGASLTSEGLNVDLVRYQKPEQAGAQAVRSGVFFLPEKKSPYQRYYTTGRIGYGGSMRIEGKHTYKNPLIVKAASGGTGPKLAYDQINGKNAYQDMRSTVLKTLYSSPASFFSNNTSPQQIEKVAAVLKQYGGNSNFASEIVQTSKEGNTLPYAIQEHIVAASVRKAGYDAVVSYHKVGGGLRLAEVFDVNMEEYPWKNFEAQAIWSMIYA